MNDAQVPALLPVLPELLLLGGAMALLMLGAFRGERSAQAIYGAAIGLLIADIAVVLWLPAGTLTTFGGSIVVDDFARFWKILVLIGSAGAIALSLDYLAAVGEQKFEYAILILLSTTGMLLMISASDLIALYLGFEMMSLALYVLAAIHRDSVL